MPHEENQNAEDLETVIVAKQEQTGILFTEAKEAMNRLYTPGQYVISATPIKVKGHNATDVAEDKGAEQEDNKKVRTMLSAMEERQQTYKNYLELIRQKIGEDKVITRPEWKTLDLCKKEVDQTLKHMRELKSVPFILPENNENYRDFGDGKGFEYIGVSYNRPKEFGDYKDLQLAIAQWSELQKEISVLLPANAASTSSEQAWIQSGKALREEKPTAITIATEGAADPSAIQSNSQSFIQKINEKWGSSYEIISSNAKRERDTTELTLSVNVTKVSGETKEALVTLRCKNEGDQLTWSCDSSNKSLVTPSMMYQTMAEGMLATRIGMKDELERKGEKPSEIKIKIPENPPEALVKALYDAGFTKVSNYKGEGLEKPGAETTHNYAPAKVNSP